jgi:hypothetical protein
LLIQEIDDLAFLGGQAVQHSLTPEATFVAHATFVASMQAPFLAVRRFHTPDETAVRETHKRKPKGGLRSQLRKLKGLRLAAGPLQRVSNRACC